MKKKCKNRNKRRKNNKGGLEDDITSKGITNR